MLLLPKIPFLALIFFTILLSLFKRETVYREFSTLIPFVQISDRHSVIKIFFLHKTQWIRHNFAFIHSLQVLFCHGLYSMHDNAFLLGFEIKSNCIVYCDSALSFTLRISQVHANRIDFILKGNKVPWYFGHVP